MRAKFHTVGRASNHINRWLTLAKFGLVGV